MGATLANDILTIPEILEQLRREIEIIKRLAPAVRAARAGGGHPPRRRRPADRAQTDGEPPTFDP